MGTLINIHLTAIKQSLDCTSHSCSQNRSVVSFLAIKLSHSCDLVVRYTVFLGAFHVNAMLKVLKYSSFLRQEI